MKIRKENLKLTFRKKLSKIIILDTFDTNSEFFFKIIVIFLVNISTFFEKGEKKYYLNMEKRILFLKKNVRAAK